MNPSTVYASSGLLPSTLEEVSLAENDGGYEWEVAIVTRDTVCNNRFEFSGGTDPRTWLACSLAREHGF